MKDNKFTDADRRLIAHLTAPKGIEDEETIIDILYKKFYEYRHENNGISPKMLKIHPADWYALISDVRALKLCPPSTDPFGANVSFLGCDVEVSTTTKCGEYNFSRTA